MQIKTLVLLGAAATISHAAIVIDTGNNPQPDEQNVLLNLDQSGNTVTGTFNAYPGVIAQFTSSQTLIAPSNGQARVEAVSGAVTNIDISLAGGYTFGDLIFNSAIVGNVGTAGQPITITAYGTDTVMRTETLTNGENFFTIIATGETMTRVSLLAPSGFADLRQIRFSGITEPENGSEIPEPSTWMLLVSGCAAVLFGRRRFAKQ